MKKWRGIFTLWVAMLMAPPLAMVAPQAASAQSHTVRSELVASDVAHNRFRLVGHGTFTAPSHIPVAALDGKTVVVEFGPNGRVIDISEAPVAIQPIVSNREVVWGQLALRDAAMGTFTLAGEPRIYVAPPTVDLRPFAGRMVEVHLDERGQLSRIDLAARSPNAPPTSRTCIYGGQEYSDGSAICQSGTQYVCEVGGWRSLGLVCNDPGGRPTCDLNGTAYASGSTRCERGTQFVCETGLWRNVGTACVSDSTSAQRSPRTCMFGGATVMNGSSICRDGTTLRCNDGEWASDGTPCR
jgi:hypothetical protein